MLTNELEIFFRQPGEVKEMRCRACGALCTAVRGAHGPTCYAEALAHHKRPHDRFSCPRAAEPWHAGALRLSIERQRTPSRLLSALLGLELRLLRLRHLDLRGTRGAR